MARKKDNKEAMFEALSRGTGSSMRLPDWAKPSSPQPFEHPEMLEKPEKRKEEPKAEAPAVPEITVKLKAAASGIARKFKGIKDNIDEKRKVSIEKKLAKIEEARKLREARLQEELLAEKLEAEQAEEEDLAAEELERQAIEPEPVEEDDDVAVVEEVEVVVDTVEVIEAELVEEGSEEPQKSSGEYAEVVAEEDEFEIEEEISAEADEETVEESEEETPVADDLDKDSDLFAPLQMDEETQPEDEGGKDGETEEDQAEDEEDAESDEVEDIEDAGPEADELPMADETEMPGEEAGNAEDDIKIPSAPAEPQTEETKQESQPTVGDKKQPVEVTSYVTATSIQQQVDLVEDNALLSQTLYARQVAMETAPEDSVHITLSKRAFLGILGGAIGIICLVFLMGNLFTRKPAPVQPPVVAQPEVAQTQPAEEQQPQEPVAPETPKIQTPPQPQTAYAALDASDEGETAVTAEPGKRDPQRYYLVVQQLLSASTKDREEAFNIVEFCKEHGLPAEVVMIDGKKLAVWSLVGLKATDDDNARKHAMMVEQLGKDYFKTSRTYDFRQRMRDGRLRPFYMRGKPYATQTDGNKNN